MTETKKRLGKGLDSLLSSTRLRELTEVSAIGTAPGGEKVSANRTVPNGAKRATVQVLELPLDKIVRNPHQPRQLWDEQKLLDMAESIQANGLIQPIVVRPMGNGYQLIAGERRLRAMRLAEKATITAIVRDANEEQTLEWALVENIHRTNLNAIERARAYHHYLSSFSLTQQEAARRLGEDRSTIANYVRLLELSEELRQMVADGRLTMGHARSLLGVADPVRRRRLAEQVVGSNLSVRELERRVRIQSQETDIAAVPETSRSAHIRELESELTRSLGGKVVIKTVGAKGHRGRIVIEFYNLDDFERIRERLAK